MKCGKCKKDGVTNEHVRDCYGLSPRQTSNATPDIDREKDAANEARAQKDARQKAESNAQAAASQKAERKRKKAEDREAARLKAERKRQERKQKQVEDRKAANRESARLVSEAQKARAEFDRQRKASECKACGLVPDINGRCNCS